MKRRWMALFMALAMLLSSVVAYAAEPLAEKFADTEKIATEIYTEGETAQVLYSPDGSISMRLCLEEDGSLTYGAFGYEERFSVWSEMGIKGIKADFFDGEQWIEIGRTTKNDTIFSCEDLKIAIYAGTGSGSAVAWYSITVEDALDSTVQVSANSAPAGRWVTVTDAKGLMNGTSETAFAPDGITTRAETAAVLMRLLEQIK